MEFALNHKIKKGEVEKLSIPNLKNLGLVPSKIKFQVNELEFGLYYQANCLIKCGEPYFRIYNEIDLSNFVGTIAEGLDLYMSIRNLSKKELELGISVIYKEHLGNIIYSSTFNYEALLEGCLKDIQDNGLITQLTIDVDVPITSVILDPIYRLSTVSEEISKDLLEQSNNWTNALAIQNEKPSTRVIIDFTDKDLKNYAKYLKFYKLKVLLQSETKDVHKIHVIAHGFK